MVPAVQMIFVNVMSMSEKNVHFAISRCSILFMTIEPNFILLKLSYLSTYFFSLLCLLFLLEVSHCNCEIAYCILLFFFVYISGLKF